MEEKSEEWSAVETVASEAEASLVVGFLESHDIPTRVVDISFHQTPTTSDEDLSNVEVAVPTSRLAEARAALEKREKEFTSTREKDTAAGGAESETVMTDEGPQDIDTE